MPWFWGRKSVDREEDDEESSYESYDSEEEYSSDDEYEEDEEESEEEGGGGEKEDFAEVPDKVEEDKDMVTPNGRPASTPSKDEGIDSSAEKDDGSYEYVHEDGTMELKPETLDKHGPKTKASMNSSLPSMSTEGDVSFIESDGDSSQDFNTSDDGSVSSLRETRETSPEEKEVMVENGALQEEETQAQSGESTKEHDDRQETGEETSSPDPAGNDDEEEDGPTTFWEKQSLLALAAEHDRVDILKGILTETDEEATRLMSAGIPPLHIAVSFGSTNATQSLLRMGADPSIRPNIAEVKKQAEEAPEGQKLEIPNMARFEGISAWELAFGNAAYEEQKKNKASWSMFTSSSSNVSDTAGERIIKPVDMPPSKTEGIRHAFTAEALRCIGGDEVARLEQLLESGMPASIDIGGKSLYDWAVQLGGLKCEELLRPLEAAKHSNGEDDSNLAFESDEQDPENPSDVNASRFIDKLPSSDGKVLDRPGHEMSVPLLINRLDELESLASALSICLDNLAEEVSVCHGLLLLGGGASALASHVKSLKNMQAQKQDVLVQANLEWEQAEMDLRRLLKIAGSVGEEIMKRTPNKLIHEEYSRTESFRNSTEDDVHKQQQLLAQIAASENKILKLRASIADLSEENTKEMEEVDKRGLTGGITLVRKLRDELRAIEFQLSETKNRTATCRAQIAMIHSNMPKYEPQKEALASEMYKKALLDVETEDETQSVEQEEPSVGSNNSILEDEKWVKPNSLPTDEDEEDDSKSSEVASEGETTNNRQGTSKFALGPSDPPPMHEPPLLSPDAPIDEDSYIHRDKINNQKMMPQNYRSRGPAIPGHLKSKNDLSQETDPDQDEKTDSERIATGDSDALVSYTPGRGILTVDLWQVLLRIVGLHGAADRRAIKQVKAKGGTSANIMIV